MSGLRQYGSALVEHCLHILNMADKPSKRDGQISRSSVSRFGRSENPSLKDSNSGQMKPMTLKLILVVS